jgi:hypothetical protein
MARANKAISEIGQLINNMLAPAITFLTSIAAKLTEGLAKGIKGFDDLSTGLKATVAAGALLTAWLLKDMAAKKAKEAASAMKDKLQSPGSSIGKPLYVYVINNRIDKKGGGTGAGGGGSGGTGGGGPADSGSGKKGGKGIGKLGGLGLGMVGGLAGDYAADALGRDTTAGKSADVLGTAASWAGMGAMLGPWGALAGGVAGAGYGAYKNFFSDTPKMANGGVVTQPTMVQAGEAGSEAIVPLYHLENLRTELRTLNTQSAEMLRYMKETADYTRQTVDAAKALNGDLFKF